MTPATRLNPVHILTNYILPNNNPSASQPKKKSFQSKVITKIINK